METPRASFSEYLYITDVAYSELRANLARYIDEVCDSRAPLLVTRQNARSVVMISEEEHGSLVETVDLPRSPANAARLRQSIAQANRGQGIRHDLRDGTDNKAG